MLREKSFSLLCEIHWRLLYPINLQNLRVSCKKMRYLVVSRWKTARICHSEGFFFCMILRVNEFQVAYENESHSIIYSIDYWLTPINPCQKIFNSHFATPQVSYLLKLFCTRPFFFVHWVSWIGMNLLDVIVQVLSLGRSGLVDQRRSELFLL